MGAIWLSAATCTGEKEKSAQTQRRAIFFLRTHKSTYDFDSIAETNEDASNFWRLYLCIPIQPYLNVYRHILYTYIFLWTVRNVLETIIMGLEPRLNPPQPQCQVAIRTIGASEFPAGNSLVGMVW